MKHALAGILLLFYGCASSTPQADKALGDMGALPSRAIVEDVPFFLQTEGTCGPATLAMTLNWAGIETTMEEVEESAFSPESNGSYQMVMISAARRNKAMALPIAGMQSLLTEVANGHPVIVFENLGFDWLPQWHYATVFGYDLKKQVVHTHSGAEANKVWDIRKFERSWKLGDYWGMVILPPGQLAKTASEREHLKAAAALEKLGHLDEAKKSYMAMAERWKDGHMAFIGLGNIAFLREDYQSAQRLYLKALEIRKDMPAVWHNLSLSYSRTGNAEKAKDVKAKAMHYGAAKKSKRSMSGF